MSQFLISSLPLSNEEFSAHIYYTKYNVSRMNFQRANIYRKGYTAAAPPQHITKCSTSSHIHLQAYVSAYRRRVLLYARSCESRVSTELKLSPATTHTHTLNPRVAHTRTIKIKNRKKNHPGKLFDFYHPAGARSDLKTYTYSYVYICKRNFIKACYTICFLYIPYITVYCWVCAAVAFAPSRRRRAHLHAKKLACNLSI